MTEQTQLLCAAREVVRLWHHVTGITAPLWVEARLGRTIDRLEHVLREVDAARGVNAPPTDADNSVVPPPG